jgi:hypothetical protein
MKSLKWISTIIPAIERAEKRKKGSVFLGRYRMVAMNACDSYLEGFD